MISYPRDFIFARSLLLILSIISDTCRRRHGERGITRAKSSRVSAGERVHQPGRFGDAPTAGLTCRKHTSALARAIRGQRLPKYLSSDHDPLYKFHQWPANLRVLEVREIKTVPYVPLSHPFVERLIGTVRREYLDRILFWTTADLGIGQKRFEVRTIVSMSPSRLPTKTTEPSAVMMSRPRLNTPSSM